VIKKIQAAELKLGMFVHDLNCGWMDHEFVRNSFMLRREADLQRILESGITEVYIDTIKGLDCSYAATREEAEADLRDRLRDTPDGAVRGTRATRAEELPQARRVLREANRVIHGILEDVRLGRQVKVERVHPVVARITDSVLRNPGTLVSLCRIREGDAYTFHHSVSVATLLVAFGRALDLEPAAIHEAGMGGMLHDLGKMRVPDHILNKPGKLTDPEFAIMKEHVELGLEVLQGTPGVSGAVVQVAGEHHERFEGTGYPHQTPGAELSRPGRMAAICDVYDALTSNRVYHRRMEPPEALARLYEWSDHHFDPELVQQFIQAIGIYPVGSLVRLDSRRLAVVVDHGERGLLFPVVRVVYDLRREARVEPVDLDLGDPGPGGDHIVGAEAPEDWGIDPYAYLDPGRT
jgi:putative nucleotidyltransferase with HDIG domain